MEISSLRSLFTGIATKRLVQVDLPAGSNQHEINGVSGMKEFFGANEKITGIIRWYYFSDDSPTLRENGEFTFYDSRAKSFSRTGRREWRLYYQGEFLAHAVPDDTLVLARGVDGSIFGLVFEDRSGWLRAALTLLGLEEAGPELKVLSETSISQQELVFARSRILEELELGIEIPSSATDTEIAERELERATQENRDFPSTRRMADLAHEGVEVDLSDGDEALIRWLEREEQLFKAIEHILVDGKITSGFSSVEDFIAYSLSVQNRRKSRMGYALQNHLSHLFEKRRLHFEAQVVTERKNKPDFVFPGKEEYHNTEFPADLLVMLGVKASCKDRWRQILPEAERIPLKHLCTLEAAISENQTDEMSEQQVVLVLPAQFHLTYNDRQRRALWSVEQFLGFVREKQQ